ncbi:MAG TPA: D-aminoacyl-tRNA deacylase [Candidatus Elarobacter sp.]
MQRVTRAEVTVDGAVVGTIGRGLAVLVGVAVDDEERDADQLAQKIAGLRIFDDAAGAMNHALADVGGAVLIVSQFTLLGDARKGRRPSFVAAARGERASQLYERVVAGVAASGIPIATCIFGAEMALELVNDGPVTILLDTKRAF